VAGPNPVHYYSEACDELRCRFEVPVKMRDESGAERENNPRLVVVR
jgi:hypothetical protein